MQQASRVFEPEPEQVTEARRFVRTTLTSWGLPTGDLPLLVSELATNAVLHARSEFEITIESLPERLRVEVSDGNPRLPTLAPVPSDAYSGRGLMLLAALAESWGVESRAAQGKTIWFEVPLH